MARGIPEDEGLGADGHPIIARIANGPWAGTLRQKAACILRRWASMLDPAHSIVIVTDDLHLMRLAIDGCVKLMCQKQAAELFEANKDYIMKAELANWRPEEGNLQ